MNKIMKKYSLGEKLIETTEERYERTFKALGYIPFEEKKIEKAKTTEKIESKKNYKEEN